MKDNTTDIASKLAKFLKENGIDISALTKMLDTDALLMAWNHTEVHQPKYTFKEAITWIKEHFNPKLHSSASIVKETSEDGKIILNCCLMDKNGEPMAEAKDPFLRVETSEICQDLQNNFGDKDMIIIR